ncbi:MAG TPA: hypothetical protein DD400_00205 [Rhodospirillaceae bacterium]|nr:hypothetical protein [Rhodospirillaceae bacterium]
MKSFRFLGVVIAAVALLLPASAHAKMRPDWYVGGAGVLPLQLNADSSLSNVTNQIEYKTGWGLSGSGGYNWNNGLRTELEFVYRHSDVQKVTGTGSTAFDGGGIHNKALMFNTLYDFKTGTRFVPYLGAGIGGSLVDADNLRSINGATLDKERFALAYQAIAGFALALEGNWSFTADYRYFATPEVKFKSSAGVSAETENASHNILMGIRYQFATPEKAPAPVPVVKAAKAPKAAMPRMPKRSAPIVAAVPQSYVVFFDFDSATLTTEAERIIASAAADYKKGKYVRLVVTGHTDTKGATSYNDKLSQERAVAVQEEFANMGVPVGLISTVAEGEGSLLIPTSDGIREAQNRRVEIMFK